MKKQLFTLTELCVIVTLFTLIAALLIPAVNASQNGAQGVLCSDNLKKLGQIQQAYLEANDDYFTPTMDTSLKPTMTVNGKASTSKSFAKWPYFMLTTQQVQPGGSDGWELPREFHCPARSKSQFSSFQYDCYAKLDYGMNYAFGNNVYQNISKVPNPSGLIIYADAHYLSWEDGATGYYAIQPKISTAGGWGVPDGNLKTMNENVWTGHGGTNVCFVDGHAEFVSASGGVTEAGRKSFWEKTYGNDPDNNQWHIKP